MGEVRDQGVPYISHQGEQELQDSGLMADHVRLKNCPGWDI